MNIAKALCEIFCEGISVTQVPAGVAVSTVFENRIGDRVAFYVVKDKSTGLFRLEDDGSLVPELLSMGVKITEGQRARTFDEILKQSRIIFNKNRGELWSHEINEEKIPETALKFVTALMRISAMAVTSPPKVKNTFKDDAIAKINAALGGKIDIKPEHPVSPSLAEFIPDLLLDAPTPVAVFIAVSDTRLYEAIFLRMAADHEAPEKCSVVAVLEKDGSKLVSGKMRQRAQNRLDATPIFYGAENDAISRIARELDSQAVVQ